jgi:hypothetical protein
VAILNAGLFWLNSPIFCMWKQKETMKYTTHVTSLKSWKLYHTSYRLHPSCWESSSCN